MNVKTIDELKATWTLLKLCIWSRGYDLPSRRADLLHLLLFRNHDSIRSICIKAESTHGPMVPLWCSPGCQHGRWDMVGSNHHHCSWNRCSRCSQHFLPANDASLGRKLIASDWILDDFGMKEQYALHVMKIYIYIFIYIYICMKYPMVSIGVHARVMPWKVWWSCCGCQESQGWTLQTFAWLMDILVFTMYWYYW